MSASNTPSVRDAAHRFDNDLRYRDGDHPAQTQFTPGYILRCIRHEFGTWAGDGEIGLDPCTTEDNPTRAKTFYTVDVDGLKQSWGDENWRPDVFVNPPYGKAREPWVERCIETAQNGQRVILLVPAATDTRIFQRAMLTSTAVVFIKGRVKFGILRPNRRQVAASHPSALIGWNTDLGFCASLGLIAKPPRVVTDYSRSGNWALVVPE